MLTRYARQRLLDSQSADPDVWYSAEVCRYASYDTWSDCFSGSYLKIVIRTWRVARHTPKGVVFTDGCFMRGKAVRQRAVPTVALALADLTARKKSHVKFAALRLAEAEEMLALAEAAL